MAFDLLINIDVPDLPRATRFYVEALGCQVGRRFGDDAVELLGGSSAVYLLAKKPGSAPFPGAPAGRTFERHWTPVHFDLVVDDIYRASERVVAAGGKGEGGITSYSWGRLAVFADPFGNGFCLLEFSARGYDAIATDG